MGKKSINSTVNVLVLDRKGIQPPVWHLLPLSIAVDNRNVIDGNVTM